MNELTKTELQEQSARRLKQIQHLLVENQKLKNELETYHRSYPHPPDDEDEE